jgi:hypothetical protein
MKPILALLGALLFLGWSVTRGVMAINLNRNCTGYLKRAADANTVPLAMKNLEVALQYAESNGLTSGYTSVLYRTPNEDVGFWYGNLKASLEELQRIGPETTQLERTNVLIKLRETLLYQGKEGTAITVPDGLSVYPSNAMYAMFGLASFLLMALAWGAVAMDDLY